jgi:hypothetical protein
MKLLRHWGSAIIAHSGECAVWIYFVIGVVVIFYVEFRYAWWRRRKPFNGPLWPASENPVQGLRYFFLSSGLTPVLFIIQAVLWPLWLLFLWAYAPRDDDANT